MKNRLFLLLITIITLSACGEDNDDNLKATAAITFTHSQNWDGTIVNSTNFDTEDFTNENGEILNIVRIRYLTSRYELTNLNGEKYSFNGYSFVDISDESTLTFNPNASIPTGAYTLKIIYGFNEEDNAENHPDLNSVSWNWPEMLGGGYHFMQFDGMYDVDTALPKPFNYHNGTARVSDGVFEQNFVTIEFSNTLDISSNTNIEIKMNIAEWFKNPNTWDLNIYDTPLMPNYDAQKLMQQNATSVFSLGEITH